MYGTLLFAMSLLRMLTLPRIFFTCMIFEKYTFHTLINSPIILKHAILKESIDLFYIMSNWKQNIRSFKSLLEEREFRNKVRAVSASAIGGQFFCEMKVELDHIHGEVQTEEKREGDVLHEELLAMKKATIEKIIEGIEKKKIYTASFPMVAKFGDVTLAGVPDAIVFMSGKPVYVIELKTTRGDTAIVYDGQKAQADIYGFLLDLAGLDCSNLKIVIVKFKRATELSSKQKNEFLSILVKSLLSGKHQEVARISKNSIVVHASDYNRENAINSIRRTKGYWLGEREPIPTTNPNKCRSCVFNKICPSSLVKFGS